MWFLNTIIIIILVFYLLGFIFRFWLKRLIKKASQKVYESEINYKKEGEITIDTSEFNKSDKSNEGEYVDYEEIK